MAMKVKTSESAILVMHYQNGIVNPEAAFAVSGTAAQVKKRNCLEKTAKALKAVRDAGMMVIFVNFELRPGWPEIKKPPFPLVAAVKANTFVRGDWDASLPGGAGTGTQGHHSNKFQFQFLFGFGFGSNSPSRKY